MHELTDEQLDEVLAKMRSVAQAAMGDPGPDVRETPWDWMISGTSAVQLAHIEVFQPSTVLALLAELERLRALTNVDDAMVERAARAMVAHSSLHHPCEAGERCCDECGEAFGWFGISQAEEDLRYASHRARAALEAALGGGVVSRHVLVVTEDSCAHGPARP